MYSSSKSAFHRMSDALAMECSFLNKNIKVMLVAPGAIKSNIAKSASGYEVPPTSMFKNFTQIVHKRIWASQGPTSIKAEDFSRHVVSRVLNNDPPGYMTLGGFSSLVAVARWVPRFLLWWAVGKVFGKPNQP